MAKKTNTKSKKDIPIESKLKPAMIRFVYLYLGGEDGKCFNNATLSYIRAYDIDTVTMKYKQENGREDYSKEYKSAKTNASQLLSNTNIQKFRDKVLLEIGYNPDNIKKRFAELAHQNRNLPIALASVDRMAKIAGVLKEDSKQVDIPQLEELGNAIKSILTPRR